MLSLIGDSKLTLRCVSCDGGSVPCLCPGISSHKPLGHRLGINWVKKREGRLDFVISCVISLFFVAE